LFNGKHHKQKPNPVRLATKPLDQPRKAKTETKANCIISPVRLLTKTTKTCKTGKPRKVYRQNHTLQTLTASPVRLAVYLLTKASVFCAHLLRSLQAHFVCAVTFG
jgi:hypothetical protein